MVNRSEQINDLAAALAKAQAHMEGAKKGNTNPHFKSRYADLASVREAVTEALTSHGISYVQFPRLVSAGDGAWLVEVETTLLHASGQWIGDTLAVPVTKADAQGVGSAITYARRYALMAVTGIAPEDDDGNAAVGGTAPERQAQPRPVPHGYDRWLADLEAVADEGMPALEAAWKASRADHRSHLMATDAKRLDALKAKAGKVAAHA